MSDEQATPFGRTIAGSAAHPCQWCGLSKEYLSVLVDTGVRGVSKRLRVWVCPKCDNREARGEGPEGEGT